MEPGEGFREVLYTVDTAGNRKWVYASLVKGKLYKYRSIVAYILLLFYLVTPWTTIGGKQGILLDFTRFRFTFFGVEFWATDTYYLFCLFGIFAFALFFFTAVLGRVWCGWACPETVFLEFLFRPIERWIEGSPNQRRKLDASPWTFEKIWKKGLRWSLTVFFSWVIATSTLAYFIGNERMIAMITASPLENWGPFVLTLVLMILMVFQFGWFREQFCTVLCPYARFQSVLMDNDSLIVGYDELRGEPRGKHKRQAESPAGDCIDCGMCVQVCPTGIDIRNGVQLECVACTACIDACDSVMAKIGKPLGLIRYDTGNGLARITKGLQLLRPRPVVYACLLAVFTGAFVYLLSNRPLGDFQLLRGPLDQPFEMLSEQMVSNHFHARVSNKGEQSDSFSFSLAGTPEVQLITPLSPLPVEAGAVRTTPVFLNFDKSFLNRGKRRITVNIESSNGYSGTQEVTLLGPDK